MTASAFMKLPNARFSGGNMPKVRNIGAEVLALAGLISWHRASAEYLAKDTGGRVAAWGNCLSGAPSFVARDSANRPIFTEADANGNPGVYFSKDRLDVLDYAGTFPTGAGAASTRILIGSFPSPGSSTFSYYMAVDGAASAVRNTLCGNNGYVRAIVSGSQTFADLAWTAGPARKVIGMSHSDASDLLKVTLNGAVAQQANTAQISAGTMSLGYASAAAQAPEMTLQDVFIFNADILAADSASLALLNEYAAAMYG